MISAVEARKLTLEAKSDVNKIEELIKNKCNQGSYELYLNRAISYETEKEIVLNGYTVERKKATCTVIRWNEVY
jgi:hypothetical protein